MPWTRIQNRSAIALGAIKATNAHGTTMTLCNLCENHKVESSFFCKTHRVCNSCASDPIEENHECPSCENPRYPVIPKSTPPKLTPPTNQKPARKIPDSAIQAGPALRLGPKLEYNCHSCSTRYTRLPLSTGQSSRCSNLICPLVRGRKRVLSLNSDCAAGFYIQLTTCIWCNNASRQSQSWIPEPSISATQLEEPISTITQT